MTDDQTKSPQRVNASPREGSTSEPLEASAVPRSRGSLKDRIADLSIGAKATAARNSLADRMKAVQDAALAADDIKNKIRGAAAAVRLDRLNRDTLKAGRDGFAAKLEALLKPRPADDVATGQTPPPAEPIAPVSAVVTSIEPTTIPSHRNIGLLKARVDDALKAVAPPVDPVAAPERSPTLTADMQPYADQTFHPTRSVTFTNRSSPAPAPTTASVGTIVAEAAAATDQVAEPVTVRTRSLNTARIVHAEAEAERSRPIFTLGMLATALTAGGVLHILMTFAVPWMNTSSAFERLRDKLETNAMRVFPADPNGQTPLPFLSADLRYAMCRYDLTANSVIVSATLPDIGWSLALYTPQGDNFYAVPGQDGRVVTAQFTLNTASDRLLLPVPGVRRSDTDATQVTSPAREGLVVIRAPNLGPAQQASVEETLKRSTCRTTPRR